MNDVKGDIAFFFCLFTIALCTTKHPVQFCVRYPDDQNTWRKQSRLELGAGHEKDIITEAVDFTVNVQRSKS